MAKINVLDKQVAELIAAGEVVERPASIVKELVENAADAGATSITVEIQGGGIRLIRVTDNGSGIERADVANAFLRHATSKVRVSEDLSHITTMGFRGEALASIAAMCRVELLTRTREEVAGTFYSIAGGEKERLEDAGCPVGTTITVRDVFYNTPARMKFLKKDVSEGNSVAAVVEKAALANPGVAFKFIRDGAVKIQTPGDGQLISAVRCILGREFAEGSIPVRYQQGQLVLEGCICKPFIARGSRTMQNFFINNRFVRSKTCMAALEEAYKNMLMVGKFPSCVLNVIIPPYEVDVNVHPAKIEVRFANEKNIFDLVYYGCKTALGASSLQPEIKAEDVKYNPFSASQNQEIPRQERMSTSQYRLVISELPEKKAEVYSPVSSRTQPLAADRLSFAEKPIPRSVFPEDAQIHVPSLQPAAATAVLESENFLDETYDLRKKQILDIEAEPEQVPQPSQDPYENARLIGELFDTYLVLQNKDQMILIDKHAAHERLLFNRLTSSGIAGEKQLLLAPVSVKLTPDEHAAILDNLKLLSDAGIAVENFGDGFVVVREVAPILASADLELVVTELAQRLLSFNHHLLPRQLEELYHTIACKAAIKAHDKTSSLSLKQLVTLLKEDGSATHCPHGRPVAIRMSRYEIEKKFGRLG